MAVLLVLLLAVLAVLQWRWIGEVSAMERQRMRSNLLAAGFRFSRDFDREITRAFSFFHPDATAAPDDQLDRFYRQYERWTAEAPYPHLIRNIFLIRPAASGGAKLEILRPSQRRFEACPWPPALAAIQQRWSGGRPPPPARFIRDRMVVGEIPALVFPLSFSHLRWGDPAADRFAELYLLVQLDLETISRDILPALSRQYFDAGAEGEYAVAVVDAQDPRRIIFRSEPEMPSAAFRDGDLSLGFFRLRPFEELRTREAGRGANLVLRRGPEPFGPPPTEGGSPPPEGPRLESLARRGGPPPEGPWTAGAFGIGGPSEVARHEDGAWRLVAKRRDGSLEQAVVAVRRRNLAISLGILTLLGTTIAMMMVTTQRAQSLARQQLEFVAGVTHELNTPLTAIRSAGQNLADGVVADSVQVKRYGALIANEGRRLSDLVAQALEFAGIQSGRRRYHLHPVEIAEIIEGALLDSRWLLQERRVEVAREVEPDLPPILADAVALRQAVHNLLQNAVKYGGQAGWIGVRARRSSSGQVEITIADRGPGIGAEDLPHLFKPFFRGRDAAARRVPGSGLGLSLVRYIVEAHGGRVTVETGEGSVFTLHLPAAPPEIAEIETVEEPA
jgi:signal transduction histidine kinase